MAVGVSFGLIADVQFAFTPDRISPGKTRFYQNSKKHLKDAVAHWNNENSSFVVQLGDVIDGVNGDKMVQALDAVIEEFNKSETEVIHVLGNHELYNFNRQELMKTPLFHINKKRTTEKHGRLVRSFHCAEPVFYFTFKVKESPGFRFVVLDTFDESILGRNKASSEYKNAMNVIRKHNNNEDLAINTGLKGIDQRYVTDNGGLGKQQIEWLDKVLTEADVQGENAVLFGHAPFHPKCVADPVDLVWNCEEVLELLSSHCSVKVSLSGHVHENVYHRDRNGIHHRTLSAVLEADKNSNAYATVHVSKDKIKIEGHGQVNSQILHF